MITNLLKEAKGYLNSLTIRNGFNKSLKSIIINNELDKSILKNDLILIADKFTIPNTDIFEWRVKNIESLELKINKYIVKSNNTQQSWTLKSATNDLIGFRIKYSGEKHNTLEELLNFKNIEKQYRVVNLLNGKLTADDGYRAIHIYYSKDNFHYPIEIQIWFNEDYYYNLWMHKHLYKQKENSILIEMFNRYTIGLINSEVDFIKQLENILSSNGVNKDLIWGYLQDT